MSIQEKREEAEAVLDSAEMLLETYPGGGEKARELKNKISELEQELQDPESEESIDSLIDDIRELMDEIQEDSLGDEMMDEEPGMGPGGMGGDSMGPEDDVPPF